MRSGLRRAMSVGPVMLLLLMSSTALAAPIPGFEAVQNGEPQQWKGVWDRFVDAWSSFGNWRVPVALGFELSLAAGLAMIIAVHPTNAKSRWTSDVGLAEQHKTLPLFATVSVMVAAIVEAYPAMALVVFGIGGLLRFRTDMGQPKLTGRALLATIMGLAVGLQLFPLAIMGTAFGWVLIYFIERVTIVEVTVGSLKTDVILDATDAWVEAFERAGCQVVRALLGSKKGEIVIVAAIPSKMSPKDLGDILHNEVPEQYLGKPRVKGA